VAKKWYSAIWRAQTRLDLHDWQICNSINDVSLGVILQRCDISKSTCALQYLDVRECDVSDRALSLISSIPNLRSLFLNGCKKISAKAFFSVEPACLAQLRHISLSSSFLNTLDLSVAALPTNLQSLHLYREKQISVQELVTRLSQLHTLRLWICSLDSLEFLTYKTGDDRRGSNSTLRDLELFSSIKANLQEGILQPLQTLTGLQLLRLHECALRDEDLRYLTSLSALRVLVLRSNGITGPGKYLVFYLCSYFIFFYVCLFCYIYNYYFVLPLVKCSYAFYK